MTTIKLGIKPMPSPRPIVTRYGTRMPEKYIQHKKLIQSKIKGFKRFPNVPLEVELVFLIKPAKSYKKNKYPVPKGDIDNYSKSVLDAIEGILYENDTLIVSLIAKKQYCEEDSISIKLTEIQI